jgi:hypothetical protein
MDAFIGKLFSCLHEVKECMWDFRFSGVIRCVTSQKSEDLIYTAAEAWKHADSKYVLLFDCAYLLAYSSSFSFIFWGPSNFIYLFAQLSTGSLTTFLSYDVWVLQFFALSACVVCIEVPKGNCCNKNLQLLIICNILYNNIYE